MRVFKAGSRTAATVCAVTAFSAPFSALSRRPLPKLRVAALAWLLAGALATNAYAQDTRPPPLPGAPNAGPSSPPNDGARAIDPGAPPPTNTPTTPSGPLPPLPAGPPAETTSTEVPPPPPPPQDRPRRPWFGGLGYASIGPFFGDLSSLDTALRSPNVLGESYGVPSAALTLGGGGGAVLFGHLWLGGKGAALVTAPFKNDRGEAFLAGGGGGFELGYVLARPRMLIIPFFALGGFAYNVRVENHSGRPMPLGPSGIAAGDAKDVQAGFATIELGFRVQRMLFSRAGGFIGGFEAGLLRSLSTATWEMDGRQFLDHPGAQIQGGYVRLTIGGGGFSFK
jgi:hypothetical protein